MPAKMTRSVPSAAVRAARRAGSHPHLASVLQEGQKNASIHASSGVIWRIPVKLLTQKLFIIALGARSATLRASKGQV